MALWDERKWVDESGVHHKGSLCWTCSRSVNGCQWSVLFLPIPGWEAEPTTLYELTSAGIDSYTVKKCPQYQWDGTQDRGD